MPGQPMAPSLAESWTVSRDGLTYEFVLRKGVKLHNGDPLGAEDVKFSFERYKGVAAPTLKAHVATVEMVDAHRVRFRLKKLWADFMTFYATSATGAAWILLKKYVERMGDDGFKKAPVGAGPYSFVSFNPGIELVLEAYEAYWRKTPSVKRLVFRSVPDESTRLAMLKRGEADIVYSIRGALAEELRRTPGLTLKPTLGTFTEWIAMPDQWDPKSPWADRRVRLAANLAIDRKAINEAEYLGFGKISPSIIPQDFDFAWVAPPYPYDPARARQLLAEAGYPRGFDAGEVFSDMVYVPITEAVANFLQAVGIRAKLRGLERASFQKSDQEKEAQAPGAGRQRRLRQRRDPHRGVRALDRGPGLRWLPGHRRPLSGAGERAGSEAARGDSPQDPATHARAGRVRPAPRARAPQRLGAPRGGLGPGPHRRPPVLGAV